jgi:hypothetical protein
MSIQEWALLALGCCLLGLSVLFALHVSLGHDQNDDED